MPRLLFADDRGRVYDHPDLLAAVRSGDEVLPPPERPLPLPAGATLTMLPGRRPVGLDPATGEPVVLGEVRVGRRRIVPHAVGATLPPGYTRTFLPAAARPSPRPPSPRLRRGEGGDLALPTRPAPRGERGGRSLPTIPEVPILPQWAYTAAALGSDGPVAWALHTDRRGHWSPASHSTPDLPRLVERTIAETGNPIFRQLARCALEWRCFTAQNTFYLRDEGAIPSSSGCNAACIGCLSAQDEGMPPSSHERITRAPTAEEMADLAVRHLERAAGRVMVSFGQGCEGEPLTRWKELERAIRLVRARTARGSIHANTNGSLPDALGRLVDAGLDSVRVSTNSASADLYGAYYRPTGYALADVVRALRTAKEKGAYVALNLLTFPGVTDREGEVERLCRLVAETGVDQVQTRPLAIDPDVYMEVARGRGAGGRPVGVRALVRALRAARPGLVVGNFSRARAERRAPAAPPRAARTPRAAARGRTA
jgi:pyruvate-formate lyase-activating enzyme